MTFEEFFKKKKISVELLKAAEPELFAEFELHYNQMGEKSFDHTKKYWFNTLRHKYHAPDEPKVEKLHVENKLAEQTITESLVQQPAVADIPKVGFKPKFKSPITPPAPAQSAPAVEDVKVEPEGTPGAPAPKLGFKPKFKSASAPTEGTPAIPEEKAEQPAEVPAPKLGFKPKFKSASAPAETMPAVPEEKAEQPAEVPAPKLGFKPKFKSAVPPASADILAEQPEPEIPQEPTKAATETDAVEEAKPAYKPKFQMRNFKPKTGDE